MEILLTILAVVFGGFGLVSVVTEFIVAHQGGDTWNWVKVVYAKFAWVRKIKW